MTKRVRIENADNTEDKLIVQTWDKGFDGEPDVMIHEHELTDPTDMLALYVYPDRYLVVKEKETVNQRDSAVPAEEQEIEAEIQAKGLNAPRLTPEHIDSVILAEQYHVFPGTTLTVCCLTLENGYHVTGESAAASPENFDEDIGRQIARRNARDKIWSLEGYLLRQLLSDGDMTSGCLE